MMKKFLAFILSLAMLFGMFGGVCTVFAASQTDGQSLGAVEPCAGHTLGSFSGVPACVNENGDLHVCENNFPDANFRKEVLNLEGADDSYFTKEESQGITDLDVSEKSISSLKGVEFFRNLTDLHCGSNQLTELDLSSNPVLTELYCFDNQLTQLDVSGNPALTDLYCDSNQLTQLDVRDNSALTRLDCFYNQLTQLDVRSNPALTDLYCGSNQLTELDVSDNPALTRLNCFGNKLTQLDVRSNPDLTELSCGENRLTELNVRNNSALTSLDCGNNQLMQLDVSKNTALIQLYCGSSQLTELDVRNNPDLTELLCNSNQLTQLDVRSNPALIYLDCDNNLLTELDVRGNPALTNLYCYENQLTQLDVRGNPALTSLYCYENQLTQLDVSGNPALTYLSCWGNQLTELDLSGNSAFSLCEHSDQSASLKLIPQGDFWIVDLSLLVSPDHLDRIASVSDGDFDPKTGIVRFDQKPFSFTYRYDVGREDFGTMNIFVKLTEPALDSVELTALPTKTTYRKDVDAFDPAGGQVTLHYSDGTSSVIDLTAEMVTGFDNSKVGKQTLTVSYAGFTDTFEIEIMGVTPGCEAGVHSLSALIPEAPASCDTQGMKAHYMCASCHKLFDENQNEVTAQDLMIPALGHIVGDWQSDAQNHWHVCSRCGTTTDTASHEIELQNEKEATETEKGYTGDKVCSVCGYVAKKGEEIPVKGSSSPTDPIQPTDPSEPEDPTDPTVPTDPTEPAATCGDLNNDGKYTAADTMFIRLIVAELDEPEQNINYRAADMNGDGKYTAADTMYVRRLVAELITPEELPVNQ